MSEERVRRNNCSTISIASVGQRSHGREFYASSIIRTMSNVARWCFAIVIYLYVRLSLCGLLSVPVFVLWPLYQQINFCLSLRLSVCLCGCLTVSAVVCLRICFCVSALSYSTSTKRCKFHRVCVSVSVRRSVSVNMSFCLFAYVCLSPNLLCLVCRSVSVGICLLTCVP